MTARLVHADCVEAMRAMEPESIDAIVTDPPYNLTANKAGGTGVASLNLNSPAGRARISTGGGFMGKAWDATGIAFDPATWREAFRVLKPGGHLAAFGGTRTYHRLACAIEDAGFEIRDSLAWWYGQGFPKSLDVGRAIDMELCTLPGRHHARALPRDAGPEDHVCPETEAGLLRAGVGTATKPAHEPIVLARKPLVGTVAGNVLRYGTGGLNVEGCRVEGAPDPASWTAQRIPSDAGGRLGQKVKHIEAMNAGLCAPPAGRWPPNVLLTHAADCGSECAPGCPVAELDRQSGESVSVPNPGDGHALDTRGQGWGFRSMPGGFSDSGGASRFFPVFRWDPDLDVPFRYVPKPARGERDAGLHDLEPGIINTETPPGTKGAQSPRAGAGRTGGARNLHPTVKPVALMEWLVRLVTPPGGTVLDPFLGSGSTGCAAVRLGFEFVGVEREAGYIKIAERRIRLAEAAPKAKPLGSLERTEADPRQASLFDLGGDR